MTHETFKESQPESINSLRFPIPIADITSFVPQWYGRSRGLFPGLSFALQVPPTLPLCFHHLRNPVRSVWDPPPAGSPTVPSWPWGSCRVRPLPLNSTTAAGQNAPGTSQRHLTASYKILESKSSTFLANIYIASSSLFPSGAYFGG